MAEDLPSIYKALYIQHPTVEGREVVILTVLIVSKEYTWLSVSKFSL